MPSEATERSVQKVVDALRDPGAYPERPSSVSVVETHISWVFLTDQFAYKLKKSVRFGFLDFSTPQKRLAACEEELRLNRRLAGDVYVDVLPVTASPGGRVALEGDGEPIDYVLRMRRLAADRALDQALRQARLSAQDIDAVARLLVDFYRSLPPAAVSPQEYTHKLWDHCRANLDDLIPVLEPAEGRLARRAIGAQLRYVALQGPMLARRVQDGRVVDGHGDLRAEHVYLDDPPRVIDCVEFSEELRQVDALDDLCFLAMDCERLGAHEMGARVLDTYREPAADDAPQSLVAFYKSYRACVRAKVAALRLSQGDGQRKADVRRLRQLLSRADHYASMLGPPVLAAVGGPIGSGKSTLARALAEKLGAELLQTDRVRPTAPPGAKESGFGEGRYGPDARKLVYEEMFARAAEAFDQGRSVVLDGTFPSGEVRRAALGVAERRGASPLYVACECPRETAIRRLAERSAEAAGGSEARPEFYDEHVRQREPVDPSLPSVRVDTTAPVDQEVAQVTRALAG